MRAGGAADVDAAIAIWLAALTHRDGVEQTPAGAERARQQFDRPVVRFAVVGGERLIGFALTVAADVDDEALLTLLAVNPEEAGRGLGRALLADAVQATRDADLRAIRLKVRTGNDAAIALYRSAGFTAQGEPAPHPLGGDPMITYRLGLSATSGATPT